MSREERPNAAPEIRDPVFTLKDLVRIAEGCTSLEELNAELKEVRATSHVQEIRYSS